MDYQSSSSNSTNIYPRIIESRTDSSLSNQTRSTQYPHGKDFGNNTIERIKNNNEVDKRSFLQKSLNSIAMILLSILLVLFCYIVIPGVGENLRDTQLAIASSSLKIGSWTISTHGVIALVVTLQGMLLGATISIAIPLLTWYYFIKFGVPMKFVDLSRTTYGNVKAFNIRGKQFRPYLFISFIFIAATLFVSCDNVALSSFIVESDFELFDRVPAINTTQMKDTGFYNATITNDITKKGFDVVLRAGSQPFHAAIGSISNGYTHDDVLDSGGSPSNFLMCDTDKECFANITVYADYYTECTQMSVDYNPGTNGISSSTYGIFGKGPQISEGQVYYRIGNKWITRIDNEEEQESVGVQCITFAAKSMRYESSINGTISRAILKVYDIPINDSYSNLPVDPQAIDPYDTKIPYQGKDFPIADPDDNARTPLPYYIVGSLSLMLQRAGDGNCAYTGNSTANSRAGNFLFDFPFELDDSVDDLEQKMQDIIEYYYQYLYQFRFDHSTTVLVDGSSSITITSTNKAPLMTIIIAMNAFTVGVLIASIYVIASVKIPIELGVLQLAILSYRSRLFEGLEYSSEGELADNFIVKVVEYEGIFWFQRIEKELEQ
ncbi:hypothetical protein HDV01_004358 [Terramyces sp. JEL0728]|nr:hypothetical protein HDV01_004358 [Terramyces sp. JEL0728]